MSLQNPPTAKEVIIRLRVDDADELLRVVTEWFDTATGPTRWIWWRTAQACQTALQPQKGGDHALVDRYLH